MRNFLIGIFLTPVLFFSAPLLAAQDYDTLKKGAEVKITSVHKKPYVVGLALVKEEAVGPNYAKVTDFVSALDIKDGMIGLKKAIQKDKDTVFVLKKDLPLLSDKEIAKAGLN
jgi:hypothetical protein